MTAALAPLVSAVRASRPARASSRSIVDGDRRRRDRAVRRVPRVQSRRPRRQRVSYLRILGHAARQNHVLRDRRAGDGSDLGLHRHPVARTRRVFRAGRLRDGDVPDALDRARRRLSERPARFHGLPRLEGVSVVLELHTALLVRGAAGRPGAGVDCVRVRLLRVPRRGSGASISRSSRRRSPMRRCCSSSATTPASAATTASPTSSASSVSTFTAPSTRMALFVITGGDADRISAARPRDHALQARPRADGDPRRRDARHVLRLQPAATSSCSSGRCRR